MALKLRKDIKKSSYYVWFLGAKESKGLRGSDYIVPVIRHLEEREKDVEPFKVSHKGLKIVQNIVHQSSKSSKPKNETIKHFIPHNTITYVYQHEDIISCILLLFNPVTKCPLHVHAYRCDSLETASHLNQQLQILIDRPENQKKILEIESRLKPVEKVKKIGSSSLGSDTGASTRESESSEERFALENSRVSSLYDSVAAELRAKLGKKNSPILLPPRDYDTVHRQKGNLTGIELRRCLNANIVGQNVKNKRLESSGGSSGIGSDSHPPSPESPEAVESRFHTMETTHSTSDDEDWNGDPADTSLYLMHPVAVPRKNLTDKNAVQKFSGYVHRDLKSSKSFDEDYRKSMSATTTTNMTKYLDKPISKFTENKYLQRQKSMANERPTKPTSKSLERPAQYFEDDGFDDNFDKDKSRSFSYEEDVFYEDHKPIPKVRQRFEKEDYTNKYYEKQPERYYYEGSMNRRAPQLRQRSPSPTQEVRAPRDRFKDAKAKFLLMEKEGSAEPPISPTIQKDKIHFIKRHQSMAYPSMKDMRTKCDERYSDDRVDFREELRSKSQQRYGDGFRNSGMKSSDKYDPKRRSMFSLIEDEHKKNSSEIAKELKRRSYVEFGYQATEDERYNSSMVEIKDNKFMKNPQKGSRYSYAEPKMKPEQKKKSGIEMLHRTSSSAAYLQQPRLGIASLHPY